MRGICGSRITRMRVSGTAHCLDPDGPSRFPATTTLPAARIWLRASRTDQPAAPSGSMPVLFPCPCSTASVRFSRTGYSSKAYERARTQTLPPCPLTPDPLCALPPSPSPSRRRRPPTPNRSRPNRSSQLPANTFGGSTNHSAHKTLPRSTATTPARAQLTQVQPRRTTGWCLPLALYSGQRDTRSAPNFARANGVVSGDPQLPTGPGWQPEPGLRPQHHP
jgi:hypothetical protein